ncbi:ATP-binding protein [Halobacteriota archaeon]
MPEEWDIGLRRPSTVSDWKKLIVDFRDQFPYDPLTALIVETFANALDAKSTNIQIFTEGNKYKILDNGKGMSLNDFKEYHNIASLTKRRGEGIGFAGVGAKVFLDRAKYTITETRTRNFNATTHWAFYDASLEWKPITTQGKVISKTGTYVEVELENDEDIRKLNSQFIKETLQQHYNAVLLGYYLDRSVKVNGEELKPWQIEEDQIEERKNFNFRYGGHLIQGFLVKSKSKLPDEFQGPFIVVHGKTVMQHWFKQYPLMSETFYGLILADYLIDILITSKSGFNQISWLWKKFHGKIGRFISDWLDEIDAKPRLPPVSTDLGDLSQELEKSINEILKTPDFVDLANSVFQSIMRRTIGVKSEEGENKGTEVEGGQATTGTVGGLGSGEGVETIGGEEGTGIIEDENGSTPIERVRRRVRGGVKIGYDNLPENLLEGWIDPGRQAITVNIGHPAYKIAEGLSINMKAYSVLVYHTLRTVLNTMIKELVVEEDQKDTMSKILSEWYKRNIMISR